MFRLMSFRTLKTIACLESTAALKQLVVLDKLFVGGDILLQLVPDSTMMKLAVVGTMYTLEVEVGVYTLVVVVHTLVVVAV